MSDIAIVEVAPVVEVVSTTEAPKVKKPRTKKVRDETAGAEPAVKKARKSTKAAPKLNEDGTPVVKPKRVRAPRKKAAVAVVEAPAVIASVSPATSWDVVEDVAVAA